MRDLQSIHEMNYGIGQLTANDLRRLRALEAPITDRAKIAAQQLAHGERCKARHAQNG